MKIAFIPACLEPGRDGVGDYTTLLAAECRRHGHETRLLSLNDPYVSRPMTEAGALRLSSRRPWSERIKIAEEFLSAFEPDFVSLQFVSYGMHPRGIDFGMARKLEGIVGKRRVHIMFHELWVGMEKGALLKKRFAGMLQRACILKVMKALNICKVHTSNEAYAESLRIHGINAAVLPLFGSIPVPLQMGVPRPRNGTLAFALYGTLHPVWPPEPLFTRLLATGCKIVIKHIGNIRTGEALWNKMVRDYDGVIEFQKIGEQAPERIADFLQNEIDFGIATTPWALIGKSATVAAMLEHGLPVIVNRDDWQTAIAINTGSMSRLLIKMDQDLPQKIFAAQREVPASRLTGVATRFLGDLEAAL
ncbi:MAG: hypothetical protein WCD79_04105 [Chthoniobacteraceae bacterium]